MLNVPWELQPRADLGPFSVCLQQEPELSSRAENTELRERMEERKSAGLEAENNPKNGQVLVEQVLAKGGENQAKLSSEKSRETEECVQHHPAPHEQAWAEQRGLGEQLTPR